MIVNIPARHIRAGDHFNGFVVHTTRNMVDGSRRFHMVIPLTNHTMSIQVDEHALDAISFPVDKRGDDHDPNPRNALLGLPPVVREPYVAPEPIAVYPVGTLVRNVREFDRGQKVVFACPQHLEVFASKDPYSSSWFPATAASKQCPRDCEIGTGDHVLTEEYKPTRNG